MQSDNIKTAWLKWGSIVIGTMLIIGIWLFSQSPSMAGIRSWISKGLLYTAWVRTQSSGDQIKPWPWAETWPLARLSIPDMGIEHIIVAHASEKNVAFTLGHLESSVPPGEMGNSGLLVRREGYYEFLKILKPDDLLVLESLHSGKWHYRVSAIYVVPKTNTQILASSANRRLTLISCYPCTSERKSYFRYVIVADEIDKTNGMNEAEVITTSAR